MTLFVASAQAKMKHEAGAAKPIRRRRGRPCRLPSLCSLLVAVVLLAGLTSAGALIASAPALAAPDVSPATLKALQERSQAVRATMSQLEAQMTTLNGQLASAQVELADANTRLVDARRQLERSEDKLDRQRGLAERRAVMMYKTGDFTWLDLVANAQSMTDAEIALEMMRELALEDRRQEVELREVAVEARRLKAQVEAQRQAAERAQATIEARRAEIDSRIAEREALLKETTAQIKVVIEQLRKQALEAAKGKIRPGQKMDQLTWARIFLTRIKVPLTADNLAAIVAWEMAEGGHWNNTAHYNPLNTSQPMPGARTFNSHGVKIYNSWEQGMRATVITINNGFYGGILAALRAGNNGQAVASAVAASPWGTGLFHVRH